MSKQKLTCNARRLRRTMTDEERKLWYLFLKKLPLNVRRQKIEGDYILDFYISEAKVAIELDGGQHYTNSGISEDNARDKYLKSKGITVLRYDNYSILAQFDTVCEDIKKHLTVG